MKTSGSSTRVAKQYVGLVLRLKLSAYSRDPVRLLQRHQDALERSKKQLM